LVAEKRHGASFDWQKSAQLQLEKGVADCRTPIIRHLEHRSIFKEHDLLRPALQDAIDVQLAIARLRALLP
jgi:hypothetical protein